MARPFAASRSSLYLGAAGVASIIFIAVFGGFFGGRAGALADRPATPVSYTLVHYEDSYQVRRAYAGRVAAGRTAQVGFDQGGLLSAVSRDEGDRTQAGAVLARLDTRRLDAARAQAAAGLKAADAALALAEATLARQETLAAQDFASRQRLDEAAANRDTAIADLAARRADLAAADAALELAEIRAPFDAEVVRRFLDEGAVVGPGEPVLTLMETGVREVRIGLPRDAAAALEPGATVTANTPDGRALPARLVRLSDAVDPATNTRLAVFALNPDAAAPEPGVVAPEPGVVVRVMIDRRVQERGFWTPVSALSEGSRGLWRVHALVGDEGGPGGGLVVGPRPVEVLHVADDHAYVRGSAREGERIIAGGVERVAPGQRVRPAGEMIAAAPGPAR